MNTRFASLTVLFLASLAAPVNAEKAPPSAPSQQAAGPRGASLKAGFQFVPASIPALSGYSVTSDTLEVARRASLGIKREVAMTNGPHSLLITIGLSQISASSVVPIIDEFVRDSQKRPQNRFVDGASRGIFIGDQSLVDPDSSASNIPVEMIFSRANIVVAVQRAGDSPGNLKPIAEGIDAAIAAQPDVSPAQLAAALPVISIFSAESTSLHPGDQTNLTLTASDPDGGATTATLVDPEGDVLESPPPRRYLAGSKLGSQDLTVVVTDATLLYAESSISFNVTPP